MANTFIQVPSDVTNQIEMHRFLSRLVEQIDVAFGERGSSSFALQEDLTSVTNIGADAISAVTNSIMTLSSDLESSGDSLSSIAAEVDVHDTRIASLEGNLGQPAIAPLSETQVARGATYVEAEADAVAAQIITLQDQLNTILDSLKAANVVS